MLKTISAVLLAVSVLAAPGACRRPEQDDAGAGDQDRAGETAEAERAECQRPDGSSPRAFPPSSLPPAHGRAQAASCLQSRDQARRPRHQARLKLIRGECFDPHCPAAPGGISGPARTIASPMVSGRRLCLDKFGRLDGLSDSRDANSISAADGLAFGHADDRPTTEPTGCIWEYPAKCAAILLLPIALAACAGSDDGREAAINIDTGTANQPFPRTTAPNCWRS